LRRQREGAPDAMNAGAAEAGLRGHGARGPVRGCLAFPVRENLQRNKGRKSFGFQPWGDSREAVLEVELSPHLHNARQVGLAIRIRQVG
jgi:hypothetical protein